MPRDMLPQRDPTERNALEELAFATRALYGVAKLRPLTSQEKYSFLDDCLACFPRLGLSQPVITAALHVATGNWPDEVEAQVQEFEARSATGPLE